MNAVMYMSEDAGAPSLTGQYGSLIEVFTKVLVDGYGSSTSLGWTKEFEDIPNNVAVFRMPSGSRTYIRVDDNSNAQGGRTAVITAYESMSDAHTGIHPCPDPVEVYRYCCKSATTDATQRGWRVIGDDKGFYFLSFVYGAADMSTATDQGKMCQTHYFGDYISLDPSDPATFCCILNRMFNYATLDSVAMNGVTQGLYKMRNSDGELGYTLLGLGAGFYATYGSFGNGTNVSPVGGKNLYSRSYVHKDSKILGSLPGLINWIGKYDEPPNVDEYFEYEGANKVAFAVTGYKNYFPPTPYSASCRRFTFRLGVRFRNA